MDLPGSRVLFYAKILGNIPIEHRKETGMSQRLNKAGFPLTRNLAKPFRLPKLGPNGEKRPPDYQQGHFLQGDGSIHPYVQTTTGCIGSMSTVGRGGVPFVLKVGTTNTPGKCFGRKTKNGGVYNPIVPHADVEKQLHVRCYNAWKTTLNKSVAAPGKYDAILDALNTRLIREFKMDPAKLAETEVQIIKCALGRLAK